MSLKDVNHKIEKNSYLTKLIIISTLLLITVFTSFIVLNTKINELKEESKELKKIQDSLEDGIYVLKEDMPTKLSELENDEKYAKENDIKNAVSKEKEEIISEITKRGYTPLITFNEYKKQVQKQIDSLPISSSTNKTVINNTNVDLEEFKEFIRDTYYPVGTLYYSMDPSFNPEDAWGGTWEKLSEGYFVEATQDSSIVATQVEAGLPEIEGKASWETGGQGHTELTAAEGAFQKLPGVSTSYPSASSNSSHARGFDFKASRSSSIYGNSDTVQPNAYYAYIWKRTS